MARAMANPISRTAYYTLAVRAADAASANPICDDTFAERFMNDDARRVWEEFKSLTPPNVSNAARHAMLDEHLRRELATAPHAAVVIIGAVVFSTFISVTGITTVISEWVGTMQSGRLAALAAMVVVLLVLGTFLDGLAMMLLTTPIFLPIAVDLGMSPIWFGIFLVRTMEIGFVTPPVGMNVYVIHGIARDIPLSTIFRGIVPFLVADFLHLALLIAFPQLALALPAYLRT